MRDRSLLLRRGLAVLAVLAIGLAAFAPAFGAAPVKKQIKKGATKILKQKIDDFGNPIFIEESEVGRFVGTANMGEAEKDLITIGPSSFTISLICTDSGGGIPTIRVEVRTSEDNSVLQSEVGPNDDFDSSDQGQQVLEETATNGTDPETFEDGDFWASSTSGLAIEAFIHPVANFGGADCYAQGWVIRIAPH